MFNNMTTSTTLSSATGLPSFRRRLVGYHPADVDAAFADLNARVAAAELAAAEAAATARFEGAARRSFEDVLGLAHQLACAVVSDARETAARITAAADAASDQPGDVGRAEPPVTPPDPAAAIDAAVVDVDEDAFAQYLAFPPDPSRQWLAPRTAGGGRGPGR
jgi:hypothetical protein